ncbi:MAG: dinitrogenase iron-molybdenum cofactor biosynthesis protein [Deltaproteobacteria bacterium]|nr:MAG: dinitrogenase iron-molybdenum cofactor biosynthesis protein [Deltaproteobacteria bacterium]
MKIAVTAKEPNLDAEVDPRFGRAAYILIVDSETLDFEAVDNSENADAFQGAGIQAATMVCDQGAEVLLTGYCGPKAFKVIEAGGVKVANDVTGTVKEAVALLNEGKLQYSDSANADGHW